MTAPREGTYEHFEVTLAQRGVDLSSLRTREDGTIVPSAATLLAGSATLEDAATGDEGLELGALLGRGGMGEVRLATQRSLRREVAVKSVLEPTSANAATALLKEAWVGASLEHPSVVPIHTLTRASKGVAVVMKRIDGVTWKDLVATRESQPRFTGEAGLEAHLRVFAQVCHAVSFAHGRGVLHLDLKLENVMIGDLGEVYVVDWGLACATADGPEWLARASSISAPLGTPSYMAPELASGDGRAIGPRTDVYLLGAMLHHVLTGAGPHQRDTLVATLAHAFLADPPTYGPEVPRELATIIARALARDPSERWESADALRGAIEGFVRHRGAEHLAARAAEIQAQIAERIDRGSDPEAELEPLFAECEVAIAEVRREWAAHPLLGALEEETVRLRVRHALLEERPDDADAWIARLEEPDLAQKVVALRARLAARDRHVRALEGLAHELDLTLGSSERRRLFGILGAMWTVISVIMGVGARAGMWSFGYRELLIEGGALVCMLTPWGFLQRRALFQNRANRRLYGGLIFTAVAVELFWVAGVLLDVPPQKAIAITPLFYAYAFCTIGLALDRRFHASGLVMLVTAALCAWLPSYALDLIGLGGGAAVALVLGGRRAVASGSTPGA